MNEELISKKELLEKYNISYGALYRWKRKGLIPEEWFIRKSTVTGQETFFIRELICTRVEAILARRDEAISLEEMAKQLGAVPQRDSRRIIIRMKYGERTFSVADLQAVILQDSDGNEIDITAQILHHSDT